MKRNSLNYENCLNFVKNLCDNVYDIKDYRFDKFENDEIALIIPIRNKTYTIYLDYKFIELKIKRENGNVIRIFTEDNCWKQALDFIEGEMNHEYNS